MNLEDIRKDFPIVSKVIYFDNACTSLKPVQVVDAERDFHLEIGACIGRSNHLLAEKASEATENSRRKISKFVGVKSEELVFTKNTTESLNLLANSLKIEKGKTVLSTVLEHHSVILPFRKMCREKRLNFEMLEPSGDGTFTKEQWEQAINENVALIVTHNANNTIVTSPPLEFIVKKAKKVGAKVVIDGAQGIPHGKFNLYNSGVDFLAFSGHKMLSTGGVGCLAGKKEALNELAPFLIGGGTVQQVDREKEVYQDSPSRFEAGIQNYGGIVALGAAVEYLEKVSNFLEAHEKKLSARLMQALQQVGAIVYGLEERNAPLASFNFARAKPHEVSLLLSKMSKICVRSGMFCAEPAMNFFGAREGAVRASLYFYNSVEEIEKFEKALLQIKQITGA